MHPALTDDQLAHLVALRHNLHETPEVSGQEHGTAERILQELLRAEADEIWTDLGGHGIAASFDGTADGPTVMIRCELDALPIQEVSDLPYRSKTDGKAHLCGHDGHMAMVLGLGLALAKRPARGRVILLFQPAEETGAGAAAVIADPRWAEIQPDYAFAFHNVPGHPFGQIGLRKGPANCASRGMKISFQGRTSHAAAPENGVSPASVMASLMQTLPTLGGAQTPHSDIALATLTHVSLGEPSFGIAPGVGEMRITLRSQSDTRMEQMIADAKDLLAHSLQHDPRLAADLTWHEVFLATTNDADAIDIAADAAGKIGLDSHSMTSPMRWSEDFGRFGIDGAKAALLFLGSGKEHPQLHNPNYDFPDALIPIGVSLFVEIIDQILCQPAPAIAPANG